MRSVELGAAENHPTGIRTRNITVPLLRAIDVWGRGDRHVASAAPTNLRPLLDAAGGSRIQMQLFATLQDENVVREGAPSSIAPIPIVGEGHVDNYRQTHRGPSVHGTEATARQDTA